MSAYICLMGGIVIGIGVEVAIGIQNCQLMGLAIGAGSRSISTPIATPIPIRQRLSDDLRGYRDLKR